MKEETLYDYETEEPQPDMHVFMSHASIGGLRRVVKPGEPTSPRFIAAGNMSEGYAQIDRPHIKKPGAGEEDTFASERRKQANENINGFIETVGYNPRNVVILRPTNPGPDRPHLKVQNIDEVFEAGQSGDEATWLPPENAGDFAFTYNPEVVLGCRPADCPVIVFKGTNERGESFLAMGHYGWQNLNAGHLEQSFAFMEEQGIDKDSLQIVVGAGASKESFPYKGAVKPGDPGSRFNHPDQDKLAVDVTYNEEDSKYHWNIDMFGFVDAELEKYGIDPKNVTHNGSDTARLDSGYSSNARAKRGGTNEVETRDLVVTSLGEPSQEIILRRFAKKHEDDTATAELKS